MYGVQTRSMTRLRQSENVTEHRDIGMSRVSSPRTPQVVLEAEKYTAELMRRNEQGDATMNHSYQNSLREHHVHVTTSYPRRRQSWEPSVSTPVIDNDYWRKPNYDVNEILDDNWGYRDNSMENRFPSNRDWMRSRTASLTSSVNREDKRYAAERYDREGDYYCQDRSPLRHAYHGACTSRNSPDHRIPRPRHPPPYNYQCGSARRTGVPNRMDVDMGPSIKVSLPFYDGKSKWQTFLRQFESVTYRWREGRKLQHLLASLRGDAAEFAFDLDPDILDDYEVLVAELEKRFHTRETRETHVRQFYSRKFKRGESIREYASDLKRLIRKAYPSGISHEVMEDMLLKQYFDGLGDEDLHYYVQYLKSPGTLDQAVELVYEYDDRRNIQREQTKEKPHWREDKPSRERTEKSKVRSVESKDSNPKVKPRSYGQQKESAADKCRLDELEKSMTKMAQMMEKFLSLQDKKSTNIENIECFKCHEMGHYASQCPSKTGRLNVLQDQNDKESDHEDEPHQEECEGEDDSACLN